MGSLITEKVKGWAGFPRCFLRSLAAALAIKLRRFDVPLEEVVSDGGYLCQTGEWLWKAVIIVLSTVSDLL